MKLKNINLRQITAIGIFFVMIGCMYVKRWYFRLEWHSYLFTVFFSDETYIGELILAVCISAALVSVFILLPVNRRSGKTKLLFWILGLLMPLFSYFITELILMNQYKMFDSALVFVLNTLIYGFVYIVVLLVSNSLRFSMIFSCLGTTIFAIINYYVVQFRDKPVFPQDFYSIKTAAAVAGKYDWSLTVFIVVGALLALALSALWMKCPYRLNPKTRITSAAAVLLMAAGIKIFVMEKNICEIEMSMWTPMLTFSEKGYALTFTYSIHFLHPEKPDNYSERSVKQITDQYPVNNETDYDDLPENIIVIMEESWSDLSVLGDVPVSSEEMPFYSSFNENVIKGSAYVSPYAGHTANSEFEFLTGNSVAGLPQGAVAYQACIKKGMPSIITWLSDLGYETVSYHPEKAKNYSREQVYSYLGFDRSYWDNSFDDNEYVRWLISDSCDFRHVEEICKNKTSDRIFIFNVTAQNHAGFGTYGMPSTVTLSGGYSSAAVDEYLSLVQITDSAIQELISYFSNVDERTVILIYGDHQPRLEQAFYNSTGYSPSEEKYDEKYITCYMLWANYDLPEDLGQTDMISVNFLSDLLLEAIGVEPEGYSRFLHELREEYPVISNVGCISSDGVFSSYSEACKSSEIVSQYNTLQYNYLFDKKNRAEQFYWFSGR